MVYCRFGTSMMTSRSEAHVYGFEEAEIVSFLAKHRIDISLGAPLSSHVRKQRLPEWLQVMSRLPTLSATEVASALSGVDTTAPEGLSDEEELALNRYLDLVLRSIAAGGLTAKAAERNSSDGDQHWEITPGDFAAWCDAKGLEYPLLEFAVVPQTDTELKALLVQKEQELNAANLKLAELEGEREKRRKLAADLTESRRLATEATKGAQELRKKLDELRQDALSGKERGTALKLIGGLLKTAYGNSALDGRLNISVIVDDLEKAGAKVSERAVRDWINRSRAHFEQHRDVP
jgi:hypothetical protein